MNSRLILKKKAGQDTNKYYSSISPAQFQQASKTHLFARILLF